MSRNAIGISRQTPDNKSTNESGQIQAACPPWCHRHEQVDVGHRDEAVIHKSQRRRVGRHEVRLHRWDQLDESRPGAVQVVLDDEFLTRTQARARSQAYIRLAALLVEAADGEL